MNQWEGVMGTKNLLLVALHVDRFVWGRDQAAIGSADVTFLRTANNESIPLRFDPFVANESDEGHRPDPMTEDEYVVFRLAVLAYAREHLQRLMEHFSGHSFFGGSTFADLQLRSLPT
jgi:hypothetical protein